MGVPPCSAGAAPHAVDDLEMSAVKAVEVARASTGCASQGGRDRLEVKNLHA